MKLIVDVRSREEFYRGHIKGSINIPLYDLEFYIDFLKGKDVLLYCNTGRRAKMSAEYLSKRGVKATVIPSSEVESYQIEGKEIICAINYLSVKPGLEEEFERKVDELCRLTYGEEGFLGSKIFRVSTISYGGSGLQGEYEDIEVKPTKYIMLTYWSSKEAHEKFHKLEGIMKGFMGLMKCLSVMPYEEYGEILR